MQILFVRYLVIYDKNSYKAERWHNDFRVERLIPTQFYVI